MSKLSEKIVAERLMWFLYDNTYLAVRNFHYNGENDVLQITKAGLSIAYEIKISKPDLRRELKLIQAVKKGIIRTTNYIKFIKALDSNNGFTDKDYAKIARHTRFITLNSYQNRLPQKYYFVIPDELLDEIYDDEINLNYGIITFHKKDDGVGGFKKVRNAKQIHKLKPKHDLIKDIARAMYYRLYLNDY